VTAEDGGAWRERLAGLLRDGEEIEAARLLQRETGCGLEEALAKVQALRAGQPVEIDLHPAAAASGVPADVAAEVARLGRDGQMINAIKLLRDHTGLGLKEAKELAEAITHGGPAPPLPPAPSMTSGAGDDEVERLLRAGRKIQAIKAYRDRTGLGLKEAKDQVEALARAKGIPEGGGGLGWGCAVTLLAGGVLGVLVALAFG
jgi:ribosomal protein L7/L12